MKTASINHIRPANKNDVDQILAIVKVAIKTQINSGNPLQWAKNPPTKDQILNDISYARSFVFDDGEIYGSFMFLAGHDPSYDYIENGEWLNSEPYGVIHRICSDNTHSRVLHEAVKFAKHQLLEKNGKINLRIDTHPDNTIMKHLLALEGFKQVGIVYIDGKLKREVFHLCK